MSLCKQRNDACTATICHRVLQRASDDACVAVPRRAPGNHGYDTAGYGPAAVGTNLWVNDWLRTWTEPVRKAGTAPLVLTRGVWAGGQRHGIVLWCAGGGDSASDGHPSPFIAALTCCGYLRVHPPMMERRSSDVESSFEELTAQINLGACAALSPA